MYFCFRGQAKLVIDPDAHTSQYPNMQLVEPEDDVVEDDDIIMWVIFKLVSYFLTADNSHTC